MCGDPEGAWRPEDAEPCPCLDHRPWQEGGHRAKAPGAGRPELGALERVCQPRQSGRGDREIPLQDHHLPLVLGETRTPLGRLDLLRVLQLLETPAGRVHGGLLRLEVGERRQGAQALDFLLRHLERTHGVVMAGLRLRLGRLGRLRGRLPGRLQRRALLAASRLVRRQGQEVLLRLLKLQALVRTVEFHQYFPGLDLPVDLKVRHPDLTRHGRHHNLEGRIQGERGVHGDGIDRHAGEHAPGTQSCQHKQDAYEDPVAPSDPTNAHGRSHTVQQAPPGGARVSLPIAHHRGEDIRHRPTGERQQQWYTPLAQQRQNGGGIGSHVRHADFL